jgi:hypothetical protein
LSEQTISTEAWTCGRCDMTIRWMPDAEAPAMPASWVEEDGELFCLACRRERAAEAGVAHLPSDAPAQERQQLSSWARLEFEIKRDPTRPDNQIAKACRTSTPAVRKARGRLGVPPAAKFSA